MDFKVFSTSHPLNNPSQFGYGAVISNCILVINVQPEEKELVKKAGASWYKTMVSDSEYTEFENFTKWLGVSQ